MPAFVRNAYWCGLVASSRSGVHTAASVRETSRLNVSPVDPVAMPPHTATGFLEGRDACENNACSNFMWHVCLGQARRRPSSKPMVQKQLVMFRPNALQPQGSTHLHARKPRATAMADRCKRSGGWKRKSSAGMGSRACGPLAACVGAPKLALLPGARSERCAASLKNHRCFLQSYVPVRSIFKIWSIFLSYESLHTCTDIHSSDYG